jgi:2-polyprenyl-3-methyl-5-hydroxy-6-metoxy-1,4-benzoquinol methylase
MDTIKIDTGKEAFMEVDDLSHAKILGYNEMRSYLELWGSRREKELTDEILRYIPNESGTLLDAGCGDGYLLFRIKERFNYELYGIDISETRLKRLLEKLPDVKIKQADLTDDLGYGPIFDVVICSETLEHIDYFEKAYANLIDMTKPGGIVIITVPNNQQLLVVDCPHCGKKFYHAGHMNSFNVRSLREFARQRGEVTVIKPFGGVKGLRGIYHRLRNFKQPHLICVVRRR